MKFRFKDWVVCTDPFYKKLETPGAKESGTNNREPALGVVEAYRITENKYLNSQAGVKDKIEYLVNFDGVKDWIGEDFLELFNQRDRV